MSFARVRSILISLHRWIGLILTPVFLVIIVTGAVLSFRPILSAASGPPAETRVDATALAALATKLEAGGGQVMSLTITDGGRTASVASNAPDLAGQWDIATATRTGPPESGFDLFRTAQQLHKSLLLGLSLVVEVASFAMLAIMVAGPFLAWLRLRNTLMGWHMAVGWLLLPLTLIGPVTAAMLVLGIGVGQRQPLPRVARPLTITQGLALAAQDMDASRIAMVRRFRGGTLVVRLAGAAGGTYVIGDKGATALTGGPGLVKQIHEGTWGGAWSGSLNFVASLALLGLTVTGFVSWFARKRRDRAAPLAPGARILVAHASQTGTAAHLARLTRDALAEGGESATLAPFGALTPEDLRGVPLVLLIASTTGEGEVPDGARHMLKTLAPGSLPGVRFCVLGLGDRSYAHFCRGAETLRDLLRAAGAEEAVPMVAADGEPTAAWTRWLETLGTDLDLQCGTPAALPRGERVTLALAGRSRLDDPAAGDTQETWSVVLESPRDLAFRPGDLIRLTPPGGGRERAYSIGSSSRVDPRRIELTVRLHHWQEDDGGDEVFGAVSGFLLRDAPLGGTIEARLDPHPNFNPPADPAWPVMMIAAGSGIAPFPGFIAERKASGRAGPAWLLFGNRHREGDFLWRARFEAALADGALSRLDTAFSRDGAGRPHVQDRLAAAGEAVLSWMLDKQAIIYVCGGRAMARGVEEALAGVLVEKGGYTPDDARADISRRLGDGRIRIDAFD